MNKNASDPDMSICLSDDNTSPLHAVTTRRRRQDVVNTQRKDHSLEAFRLELRQLITTFMISQREEMKEINTTMKDMQDNIKNIQETLAQVTIHNEELKLKFGKLENAVKEDREYIIFLEDKLEELQLGYRKANFEMKGVPRMEKETKLDLTEMAIKLSEVVGCKMSKSDIKDIYRVRGKNKENRNTPIVVETGSVLVKTDLLKMAKSYNIRNKTNKLCAKHLGFKTQEDIPIYLSENLTRKAARLHFLARDLAQTKAYKFVWTSYGKVYVRKNELSPIIFIKSEQQVHQLLLEQD
jgi:type III secretion system FlhB-like substrate exporter